MARRLLSHLTYSNVMATFAVFVALGGGAYAALRLPANSVGTKQLKKRAVTPRKVSPATVALFKGQRGAKGDPGLQGPKGDTGQTGDTGPQGPGAMSFTTTLPQGSTGVVIASTPDGIAINADCSNSPSVGLTLTPGSGHAVDVSGVQSLGGPVSSAWWFGPAPYGISNASFVSLEVIARDATYPRFDRLDLHADAGSPCNYWGVITPSG